MDFVLIVFVVVGVLYVVVLYFCYYVYVCCMLILLFYPTVYINLWGMPKDVDTQILKRIRPKYIFVFVV